MMPTHMEVRNLRQYHASLVTLFLLITALWWSTQSHGGFCEFGVGSLRKFKPYQNAGIEALEAAKERIRGRIGPLPALTQHVRSNYQASLSNDDARPHCPSSTTSGTTRRSIHISEMTNGVSVFKAAGDGLYRATVGHSANISIKLRNAKQAETYPETGPFFSVLAVGKKRMFSVSPSEVNLKMLSVNFSYTPTIPGIYDLYVEQISRESQKQIEGSPFRLVVTGSSISEEDVRRRADELPSCQTIPHDNPSWIEGDWVTRELAGDYRGTLRSGWVYQPKKCSFDIFTIDDLELAAASPELKTIVVIGRSTERGVFLSLVDLVLKRSEKRNIIESDIWKCWGFAQVQVGSLRMVFRDFRIEEEGMSEERIDKNHVHVICHDHRRISTDRNYFDDAIAFLRESIFKDQPWPDVMFLITRNVDQLRRMIEVVPPTWNGTVYPTQNFKCHEGFLFTAEGRKADIQQMNEFSSVDSRIRIVDGFALARTMRHTTEAGPFIMKTLHWHKSCDEYDGNVRVCGDGAEIMAQLLLANALAPNGKTAWLNSLDRCPEISTNSTREIQVCHDCPLSLLPHHIEQIPKLTCYKTRTGLEQKREKKFQAWDGTLCPKECMKKKPVRRTPTGSRYVKVRECTIRKP